MVLEKFDVSLLSNSFYSSGRDLVFFFFFLNFPSKSNFVNKEDKDDEKYTANLERIKERNNICGFEIKELDDDGKRELIKEYLSNYLKALDEKQIDTICGFEASKNPLFLKILLKGILLSFNNNSARCIFLCFFRLT